MKRLICIMAIAGLYAGCSPQPRDLTAMTGKLDAAVNAHDVDAAMNFMANNATVSDPMGGMHTGN